MLLQVRAKKAQKKCKKSTLQSFNSVNTITSNPEIQVLLDKLQLMTDEIYNQKPNPLNLAEWGRIKYIPSQSQNRIKIQNRISMKKAQDEKARPRIKPIKRYSLSEQKPKYEKNLSYKEHYKEIISSLNEKKKKMEDQSEQQLIQNKDSQLHSTEAFKYYNNIKKYTHFLSYIQDKINSKEITKMSKYSQNLQKKFTSNSSTTQNQKSMSRLRKTSKTIVIGCSENQIKIDSIIKKWRPKSRNQTKMMTTENIQDSRKIGRYKELTNITVKMPSPRYASELNCQTSLEKQHLSQIINVK